MRIVIDLQGAQGGSRYRGIGRYLLALVTAMIRQRGHHEIILALNGYFQDSVEFLRQHFAQELPPENIRVWSSSRNTAYFGDAHVWEREAAQLLREAFIASLKPDIVLVGSLFEGGWDAVSTSIGRLQTDIPTAVILYDLLPLIYPSQYLLGPQVRDWYEHKLQDLRRADYILAISESSQQEALSLLNWHPQRVSHISAAADARFIPLDLSQEIASTWRCRHNITRKFVFYIAAADARKNIAGLIRSYALLPKDLRDQHQLVIACANEVNRSDDVRLAHDHGMNEDELIFLGYVTDDDLLMLYNLCTLFVFPSWHEGFGLPILEAMSCGRAVIASNVSSLPEVVGRQDALFDPFDDDSISAKIREVLVNPLFRRELENYGLERSKQFSWDISAQKAWVSLETLWLKVANSRDQEHAPQTKHHLYVVSSCTASTDLYDATLQALRAHYTIEVISCEAVHDEPLVSLQKITQYLQKNPSPLVIYILPLAACLPDIRFLLQEFPGALVFSTTGESREESSRRCYTDATADDLRDVYSVQGYVGLLQILKEAEKKSPYQLSAQTLKILDMAPGVIALHPAILKSAESLYGKESVRSWRCIDTASSEGESFTAKTLDESEEFCSSLHSLLEEVWRNGDQAHVPVINKLRSQGIALPTDDAVMAIARDIAWSIGPRPRQTQLLVDISELVHRDAKTGIQRVVRSILRELLLHPPSGHRVEPIYANANGTYGYARRFTQEFLGLGNLNLEDQEVDFFAGDTLLHLDLNHHIVIARHTLLKKLRGLGVKIGVVVYDLLPVSMPWAFPSIFYCLHDRWLRTISEANAVYCISETVAHEFKIWLSRECPARIGKIDVSYFHLGSDIASSAPTTGLPPDSPALLQQLKTAPSFLIVGTLEPRKGHRQTIQAFDMLWSQGVEANLVIVGKEGWNVEKLMEDLKSHPRLGRQLFWLSGISDEFLTLIYEACSCLLAPSEGEGFGLPLIEAARHNLPAIARDLPVFREVAGTAAEYFSGLEPHALAKAITDWLGGSKGGAKHTKNNFQLLTWRESASQLLKIIGL